MFLLEKKKNLSVRGKTQTAKFLSYFKKSDFLRAVQSKLNRREGSV